MSASITQDYVSYPLVVGDQVTICRYTDRHSYTVIKISASGKTLTLQRDNCRRLDAPVTIPEGWSGHTINNSSIRWECTPNPDGNTTTASIRKNGKWVEKGYKIGEGGRVIRGSHEHYDYNF